MSLRYALRPRLKPFLSIMLGFAVFLLITGGKILWPTYTEWLMQGDSAQHWLGWEFFRHSPLFQWPVGANPDFGLDISSSIVFTDSIPLLAFIFKPLSALLPIRFQYTGLWILICFSLQSYFAWKLIALFTQHKWLQLIGSTFFALAPVCLFRAGGHHALFGQWVLLAGLYLYFSPKFSIYRWVSLQVIVALIHAYLLVMVLAIYSADLFQRCLLKKMTTLKTIGHFFVAGVCVAIIMWAAGYFMLGSGVEIGGFDTYRMNLLSLIDPNKIWSQLLPTPEKGVREYEGFNYLGLGMIGLGLVAGYKLFRSPRIGINVKIIPILFMSILLFVCSISNNIAIGTHVVMSYKLSPEIQRIASTFRCSGRFFWPVYYLIYLAILYVLFNKLKFIPAIVLCVFMLFSQLVDSKDALFRIRNRFSHPAVVSSPIHSHIWSDMALKYNKIIVVQSIYAASPWMYLSEFAATHRMAINVGYFARVNPEREYEARERVVTSILNNKLSPDSLYIFEDEALWQLAFIQMSSTDVAGVVDGFRIVAPNLKDSVNLEKDAIEAVSSGASHYFDCPTEGIDFSSNGNCQKFLIRGWSTPEPWGTWSDGDSAWLVVNVLNLPEDDVELLIEGYAFLADKIPSQEIEILVNQQYVATLKYDRESNNGFRAVKIPKRLVWEHDGQLAIRFNFKNLKSPAELNMSADSRRLGLGFVSLKFRPAKRESSLLPLAKFLEF